MFKRNLLAAALLAGAAQSPVLAIQSASTAADPNIVVQGQKYEKRVVCRYEQNTGTRFPTRTCHTAKEWDDIREAQIRAAHEMFDRAVIETRRD